MTSAPASRSSSASTLARDVGARQQEALRRRAARARASASTTASARILGRRQVDAHAVARAARRGRLVRPRTDADALQLADVAGRQQPLHEVVDAVGAREHDPVERAAPRRTARSSAAESSGGAIRIVGAGIASAPRSSSISTSSPACSRERVTTMRRPKSGRSSNQRRCSRSPATAPTTSSAGRPSRARVGDRRRACPATVCCDGSRAVVDQRRGLLGRAAVREQRLGDRARSAARRRSRPACRRAAPAAPSRPPAARRSPPRGRGRSVTTSPAPG